MKELRFIEENTKDKIENILNKIANREFLVDQSIPLINLHKLDKEDFIKNETATEEMLDFINLLLTYNTSMCIAGNCGGGKTVLLNEILEELINKTIFIIESGSRELELKDKNTKNTVIHSTTVYNKDENLSIKVEDLLAVAVSIKPDIICLGEMRSKEVFYLQEIARAGYTVIGTVHSNDSIHTYKRLVNLCKEGTNIDDDILMKFVTEAFPIIVYVKQLADKSRKITEIMECIVDEKGNVSYNTLFRYKVTENRRERDKVIIDGYFEKVNNISENMKERLLQNGMPYSELEKFLNT